MRTLLTDISRALVFLAVVIRSDAAFSTDNIAVIFRGQQLERSTLYPGAILDTGTISYRMMFGTELWRRHGRNRSDAGLAEDIVGTAGRFGSVRILLEVSNPHQSRFDEVMAAIERLKIASKHAPADRKIEIVVFALSVSGEAPTSPDQ
jgi:hypothetical protein